MKISFIFLLALSCTFALNNLQIRGCLDDATAEEVGQCYNQLRRCFELKPCQDEFTKLFNDCEINLDDKDFDLPCFQAAKEKAVEPLDLELINCFDSHCGLFGATPAADMEAIYKQILENIHSYKEKERESRTEEEAYLCLRQAFTDPSKCYQLAENCDIECAEDLDKLRTCEDEEEKNCTYHVEEALPHLVNENAKVLGQCIFKYCYENQPPVVSKEQAAAAAPVASETASAATDSNTPSTPKEEQTVQDEL